MRIISREMLQHFKTQYQPGTRVKLTRMNDPYTKLRPGEMGTVIGVDDIGTIHVNWDCGSTLGVAYGEDACTVVEVAK